jgi:sulfate adenylyltransferase subunit 1
MVTAAVLSNLSRSTEPALSRKKLLRFSTAGSVDDGKSTLIGRLLYDAKSVYEDQLKSIQKSGINRADGPIDFSLLTDGLRAEREQGITIDVAYRYFSTAKRKFIIADTPGHEQYTRNMVTGASTADAAIILIDARKGLLAQSRRHTYIASLLGIQHVIAAVNKMDLVDYREDVFREIAHDFENFAGRLGVPNVYAIPISALKGDGIVLPGNRMTWFDGPPLLEHLENLPDRNEESRQGLRLPVQYVIRPNSHFRGFAGQVVSGQLRTGAKVIALPSGMQTRVKSIITFNGELSRADANSSATFTVEDEIDLSRGDLLVSEESLPQTTTRPAATLVWMHSEPGRPAQDYLLKHTTRIVRARLRRILHRVDVNTLEHVDAPELHINDIAAVHIETAKPLFFDPYRQNRTMGSFILIDPITNATVAAGILQGAVREPLPHESTQLASFPSKTAGGPVRSPGRRAKKKGLIAAIWVVGRAALAEDLERMLRNGWTVQLVSGQEFGPAELKAIATILQRRRVVTILSLPKEDIELKRAITDAFGETRVFTAEQPTPDSQLAPLVLNWLDELGLKRSAGQ